MKKFKEITEFFGSSETANNYCHVESFTSVNRWSIMTSLGGGCVWQRRSSGMKESFGVSGFLLHYTVHTTLRIILRDGELQVINCNFILFLAIEPPWPRTEFFLFLQREAIAIENEEWEYVPCRCISPCQYRVGGCRFGRRICENHCWSHISSLLLPILQATCHLTLFLSCFILKQYWHYYFDALLFIRAW